MRARDVEHIAGLHVSRVGEEITHGGKPGGVVQVGSLRQRETSLEQSTPAAWALTAALSAARSAGLDTSPAA